MRKSSSRGCLVRDEITLPCLAAHSHGRGTPHDLRPIDRRPHTAAVVALLLSLLTAFAVPAAETAQELRFVPQLALTDFQPRKVMYAPGDASLLLVVNVRGRLDLFDLSGTEAVKIAEIVANAEDAAFGPVAASRAKTPIVTAGADGTVRLWALDGSELAEPFTGHRDAVNSVTFSRDGTRIASGGRDGTVRVWSLDGRTLQVFKGHAGAVNSVAFSPDGQHIASAGKDGTVRMWGFDGRELPPFGRFKGAVNAVAFSPDGQRIASGGQDALVHLWSLDGTLQVSFQGHARAVDSVVFSPDGTQIVSGSQDGTLRLWTLDGKAVALPFQGHAGMVEGLAFSSDQRHIASASADDTVRIWSLAVTPAAAPFRQGDGVNAVAVSPDGALIASGGRDGQLHLLTRDGRDQVAPVEAHRGAVASLAFASDGGRLVTGGEDGAVRLWTPALLPAGAPLVGHSGTVTGVAFLPDGRRLVSSGQDGTVRLWSLSGQPLGTLRGHEGAINGLAVAPDGAHIASCGDDGTMRLWALKDDGTAVPTVFRGHEGRVTRVAFSPDGQHIVSAGQDNTVRMWTLQGKAAEPWRDDRVTSVAFSPDGQRVLTGRFNGTVTLRRLDGGLAAEPFRGHQGVVTSVGFFPDGKYFVSGSKDGTVRLWTLEGSSPQALEGQPRTYYGVAFSPNGEHVTAGGADGALRLWSFRGETTAEIFKGHEDAVQSVAFSRDGQHIVSGSIDATVRLWSLAGRPSEPFEGHQGPILSVALSPDGRLIVSGGADGAVRLWTRGGRAAAHPFLTKTPVLAVAFSPDNRHVAAGSDDGSVRLWTITGEAAGPFKGHEKAVQSVAFSPDGTLIASGSRDGTVRLWTLTGAQRSVPFDGHVGSVQSVVFTPDGGRVVSVGDDGTARLWSLEGDPLKVTRTSCSGPSDTGWINGSHLWAHCSDRIEILSAQLEPLGELFLLDPGIVALIQGEGAYIPDQRLVAGFHAVDPEGRISHQLHGVPEVPGVRVRQALLDMWTLPERLNALTGSVARAAQHGYARLGWLQLPFWPALAWSLTALVVGGFWVFAPHQLAAWAMPMEGSTKLPKWAWLAQLLSLITFLGSTRRPLLAWLRKNRPVLLAANFTERDSVKEREKYCDLGYGAEIEAFQKALRERREAHVWVHGVGGNGKTALACRLLRDATPPGNDAPLPVLVDEDWSGDLVEQIARQLTVDERHPSREMIETLGGAGALCLIVDSLSERGSPKAADQVREAARALKLVIVTSRKPPPEGAVWETFRPVETRPITSEQVRQYCETYAPPGQHEEVLRRIAAVTAGRQAASPLFLRFAIEHARDGEVATSAMEMVIHYVEALRERKVGLNEDDMRRAASIAATAVIHDTLAPREVEPDYLRGMLAAEKLSFKDADGVKDVEPAALLQMLVQCGLLTRNLSNRRIQFAYDPVAEHLAAWRIGRAGHDDGRLKQLAQRIRAAPDSPVARALAAIEAAAVAVA